MTGHPDPLQQHDRGLSIISPIISCSLLTNALTVSPGSALEALHKGRRNWESDGRETVEETRRMGSHESGKIY